MEKEMLQNNNQSHINALNEMSKLIQDTDAMNQWFDTKKKLNLTH